ncbi:hypothetical protein LUZ28_27200, partial [Streptomyces albireticuli]|nr:hypothetical protein [Streptomyces albireticuli]MCD9196040.1 hypothetical protein [Streptomyces albireticuli]
RSPCRRRPPPCGRTGAGGTTRWNNSHKPSGTNRSTSFVVTPPPHPTTIPQITPNEMTCKKRAERLIHTQAMLTLARRRVNVLWAMLSDKRLFTSVPPVTQTA